MSESTNSTDVIVVGAGLAGLHLAGRLHAAGRSVLVLDGADAVGGRVRTDRLDGFLLDRGFQVLLTAYPTARLVFDYDALDLRAFEPGAMVGIGEKLHHIGDPFRRPGTALTTLASPAGSLADKLRLLRLRATLERTSVDRLFEEPETSTVEALRDRWGFSDRIIERFFRPFIGGVTFDGALGTSSRFFHFVMKMFAAGDAAVPAAGMQALPEQLAARLPEHAIVLGQRVTRADAGSIRLDDGTSRQAKAVVLATGGYDSLDDGRTTRTQTLSVTTLYFGADRSPAPGRLLVLDGDRRGPVNNVAVMSDVAAGYAPDGRALISASVLDDDGDDDRLVARSLAQLGRWMDVSSWSLLRIYRIRHALPDQASLADVRRPVRLEDGLFACGDHRDHGSIEGALQSAERAADVVLAATA